MNEIDEDLLSSQLPLNGKWKDRVTIYGQLFFPEKNKVGGRNTCCCKLKKKKTTVQRETVVVVVVVFVVVVVVVVVAPLQY